MLKIDDIDQQTHTIRLGKRPQRLRLPAPHDPHSTRLVGLVNTMDPNSSPRPSAWTHKPP
ncbi:hypothetical protein ACWGBH_25080 [Streptomyces massasporeus]